jgi:hypothetical protein
VIETMDERVAPTEAELVAHEADLIRRGRRATITYTGADKAEAFSLLCKWGRLLGRRLGRPIVVRVLSENRFEFVQEN